jgi:hypothetical protein
LLQFCSSIKGKMLQLVSSRAGTALEAASPQMHLERPS